MCYCCFYFLYWGTDSPKKVIMNYIYCTVCSVWNNIWVYYEAKSKSHVRIYQILMRQIGKLWILSLDRFSDRKKPGWIWVIILKILSLEQKWHPLLAWTWLPASSLSQWPMSVPACPHSKFLLAATGPTPQTSGFCGYFHLIVSSRICSVHTTVSAGVTQ